MNNVSQNYPCSSTSTTLRRATQDPKTGKIIEEPIALTTDQLQIFANKDLTRLQEAVVKLSVNPEAYDIGSGSAVIISPDGLAVTNRHVAETLFQTNLPVQVTQITDSTNQTQILQQGYARVNDPQSQTIIDSKVFFADLISIDQNTDLALIKINKPSPEHNFSFVSFEEGNIELKAGDESYALGHPAGVDFNILRRSEVIEPLNDLSRNIFQAKNE